MSSTPPPSYALLDPMPPPPYTARDPAWTSLPVQVQRTQRWTLTNIVAPLLRQILNVGARQQEMSSAEMIATVPNHRRKYCQKLRYRGRQFERRRRVRVPARGSPTVRRTNLTRSSGSTWAYSSSVLDPFLYYPDWDEEDSADPSAPDAGSQSEDDSHDERKWTAEEDLTVVHAWPEGGDVLRAIIYMRSIFPFIACGLVYLDDPEPEDRLEEEEPTALLDPSNWNEPEDVFAKYYGQHTILPYAGYHAEASSSVPSLSFSSSSPLRPSSSLASASSASSPSFCTSNSSSGSLFVFGSSPGTFPKYTPAPRPAQRKRIRHLQRRIGTLTRTHAEDETRPERFWKLKPKKKPKATRETSEDREYRETSVEI
ncbi:hypothetical protein C8R43DRAFT_963558 [Mycena crocata]|nr:hypothetical protein C8R43DRAFT_963558 [Mycena crocata]